MRRSVIGKRNKYVTEYIPVTDEDFMPPAPDNRERGREQLFDIGHHGIRSTMAPCNCAKKHCQVSISI